MKYETGRGKASFVSKLGAARRGWRYLGFTLPRRLVNIFFFDCRVIVAKGTEQEQVSGGK